MVLPSAVKVKQVEVKPLMVEVVEVLDIAVLAEEEHGMYLYMLVYMLLL